MNSSPLLDLASAPLAPDAAGCLAPLKGDFPTEPFGELLDQVTLREPEAIEEETVEPEIAVELPEQQETSEEDAILSITPLICFCPPPDLPIVLVEMPQQATSEAPPTGEIPSEVPIETDLSPITTEPKAQKPSPEPTEFTDSQGPKISKELPPKPARGKGIELDPKLFQPASEDVEIKPLEVKTLPRLTPPREPTGTVVAKLEEHVKKSEKTAEIAPPIEQKMPVRETFRRPAPDISRYESIQLTTDFSKASHTDFQVELPAEVAPSKSLDAVQLVETIRTEVTNLRQRGHVAVSVILQPDNGTQLKLDLWVNVDGSIHAEARCERGDFQSLNAQWPQLQQSLATHGIRVTDLSNTGNGHPQQSHSDGGHSQNFDRGQNPQHRQPHDLPNFEDEMFGSKPRFQNPKPNQPPADVSPRRWQSWA